MKPQTVLRLLQINRDFYSKFARAFSDTRSERQSNLDWIIAGIPEGVKVLDAGCGNGRLALALDRARKKIDYVGVDASAEMITIARERAGRLQNVRAEFFVGDLADPNWAHAIHARAFDRVIALAVLHHLPSFELRTRAVADFARMLAPRGQIALTNWQFMQDERQSKKIVAWELVGIDAQELEEGDALLAWKRGGVGYRYCHQVTKVEIEKVARECGLRTVRQFSADGKLNLSSVLEKI